MNLHVEIKPREDGKPGHVGYVKIDNATILAFGKDADEVAAALVDRLGDFIRDQRMPLASCREAAVSAPHAKRSS